MKNLIIFLAFLSSIFKLTVQDQINQIYSSFSANYLNQTNSWRPFSIQIAKQCDLVFVSCGIDGISIIDYLGTQVLYQIDFNRTYVQIFQISDNGQMLFLAQNSTIKVYQLSFAFKNFESFNMTDMRLLQTIEYPQFISQMIYAKDIDMLIISGFNGLISSYNTITMTKFYLSGQYLLQVQSIQGLSLSYDYQYLYVGAYLSGMFVLKINQIIDIVNNSQNKTTFILAGAAVVGNTAQSCLQTKDFYIYCNDVWSGLYFANAEQLAQSSQNQYPVTFQFTFYWPQKQPAPTIKSIIKNSEETMIFCTVRSFGIYLIDIRQREKLKLIQLISSDSYPFSIQLSRNELYLYMSGTSNIYTFNQVQVSLNDDFPNLFNIHQSNFQEIALGFKLKCRTDFTDKYLFGAFDYDGIYVFPIYKNPYRLNTQNFQVYPYFVDSMQFDQQGKYIIFPQYFQGPVLSIYQYYPLDNSQEQKDISPMNMKLIKNYYYNTTDYTPSMSFSVDRTLAVQSFQTFLIIYNSEDILDFQILSIWQKPDYLIGDLYDSTIVQNNKWIIGISEDYGYFILDIQNKQNPILANYSITQGGFTLLISQYHNLVYLAEGTQGFSIIDTEIFPEIQFISRVALPGYTYMVYPIQKEEYIMVTQSDKGLLTLIDIRNKYNPVIINQISYLNQNSQAVCSCNTLKYIFITTSNGILTMPTQSEIKIHTEVFLIKHFLNTQQNQKQKFSRQNFILSNNNSNIFNEYIFQVGQTIVLDFTILYLVNLGTQISNVYIYQNGIIVNIPQYFTFDQQQKSLYMQIDSQLIEENQEISNLNIILIQTYTPMDITSFIYSPEDQDDLGVTNSTQSSLIYYYLITQNIIDFGGRVCDNYNVQKTLNFDLLFQSQLFDQKTILNNSYQAVLFQITQKVSLTLKKSYSFNPFKYYVTPSLKFDYQNKFQFISTNSLQTIQVILQINSGIGQLIHKNQDSVSFQISESQDQLQIIGTLQNVNNVLSQQIIFANSTEINQNSQSTIQITINDNINYPLKSSIKLYDCNFIRLKQQIKVNKKYNLQQQIENQFKDGIVDIESDIAISFSSKSFLVGDTKSITYSTYIQNSDGEYVQIPPSLWLQQQSNDKLNFKGTTTASQYNNYYKFQVKATDGYTSTVDYFAIQVSGVPFTYAINLLIKILGPLLGILGLYQYNHHFYNIIFQKQVTFSFEEVECGKEYLKKLIIIGKQHEDGIFIVRTLFKKILQKPQDSVYNGEIELQTHRISDVQQKNMDNLFERKNDTNQQDEINFKDFENFEQTSEFCFKKKSNSQQFQKALSNFQKIKSRLEKSNLEKRYLNNLGNLVLSQAIKDIINLKIKPDTYQNQPEQSYLNELTDVNSILQRTIRAQISRYHLKLDKKTQIIYDIIKSYCFQNIHQNKNDWYKAIVRIQYKNNSQQSNNQSLFNTFPSLDFKEVIFADVLGFPQKKPSRFQPSIGQSIHDDFQYSKYGFSKNMRLPTWLQFEQKNGFIILHGIPSKQDIEEILIKIYDTNKQPRILQNSFIKSEFQKSPTNSLSPSFKNYINFTSEFKENKSELNNSNQIFTNQRNQDDHIQGSMESNIGEELGKSETIILSSFTPHNNSIAEKQVDQFQIYLQKISNRKYDEINENE
ncbi:hypothetical protein ABPG73_011867 [Tetrahymena malaccensis]